MEIRWWLGFKGGDSVVPELVLVISFDDGAYLVVGFDGGVESVGGSLRWVSVMWFLAVRYLVV